MSNRSLVLHGAPIESWPGSLRCVFGWGVLVSLVPQTSSRDCCSLLGWSASGAVLEGKGHSIAAWVAWQGPSSRALLLSAGRERSIAEKGILRQQTGKGRAKISKGEEKTLLISTGVSAKCPVFQLREVWQLSF